MATPDLELELALDNHRLAAELRASRARIVEAADDERRRIARDLHDGLQARLVLLSITAHALHADAIAPPSVRSEAAELSAGLQAAITELAARGPASWPTCRCVGRRP